MASPVLGAGEILLVASRGTTQSHGLFKFEETGGTWKATQLASVNQLSALALHPSLPVAYGTSGVAMYGSIHAWRFKAGVATTIGEKASGGAEPCHLAVDPSGRLLIVTNYTSGTLAIQNLANDGSFDGAVELVELAGGGPDRSRQDGAHPHQAIFHDGTLYVIDLGADLVRAYTIDPARRGATALVPAGETAVPGGTGPRHAVVLPDGRFAISGELASNLIVGRPGIAAAEWANVPSTVRKEPVRTSHAPRYPAVNFPGDIERSPDGRIVYFANRGHDTISVFDVAGAIPRLIVEIDAAVNWPQHILVLKDRILVAGWDSSKVVALPLDRNLPGQPELAFECPGPGWLTVYGK